MATTIIGIVLIAFQLIGDIGNLATKGLGFYNFPSFLGYSIVGIIGCIFLIIGIANIKKGRKATIVLHEGVKPSYTIISYFFPVVLGLFSFLFVIDIFKYFYASSIFLSIGNILLFTYLLLQRSKKPTFLFSLSILLIGLYYIVGQFETLINMLYFIGTEYFSRIIFLKLIIVVASIIYIVIAIMLYREKFSIKCIKILGSAAFALLTLNEVFGSLITIGIFQFDLIDIILPLTIFIYTCIIPISNASTPQETNILE